MESKVKVAVPLSFGANLILVPPPMKLAPPVRTASLMSNGTAEAGEIIKPRLNAKVTAIGSFILFYSHKI
jgi:hypothetical protein